jgi:hypothetical protein
MGRGMAQPAPADRAEPAAGGTVHVYLGGIGGHSLGTSDQAWLRGKPIANRRHSVRKKAPKKTAAVACPWKNFSWQREP